MRHIQQAFIRKNTSELREKLKELGYKYIELNSKINNPYIVTNIGYDSSSYSPCETNFPVLSTDYIDCGENEELFLSIVALRDDSDKYQWITDGNIWEISSEELPSRYMQINGHKATLEELIGHFK